MNGILNQISTFTRIALATENLHEHNTPTGPEVTGTIHLPTVSGIGTQLTIGKRRPMNLRITTEDDLLNVSVTYPTQAELVHERLYGIHPADLDERLETLSHPPILR